MELILALLLVVIAVIVFYHINKESEKPSVKQKQETVIQSEEQLRIVALEKQYGKRNASLDKDSLHVWVYDKSRVVVVFNKDFENKQVFSFDEIVGCDLSNNDIVEEKVKSETTYVTKTSGKSVAGRALAGAIIAGPVGAVLGGATAKKTTIGVTTTSPERTVRTTWYAVIHVLKDGVEDKIFCNGYGSSKLKSMIDDIITKRDSNIEMLEGK